MFYHTFIELSLEKLFNCASKPSRLHADGVARREAGGIAGIVASYIGVTAPQARESLHLHFLMTILGFQHPEVLRARFKRDFEQTVQDVWKRVASIYFGRTEAMAAHLDGDLNCVQQTQSVTNGVSPATSTLRDLPLLPLNEKQLADVGVAVASASKRAQLQARGLPTDMVITLEASTKFDAKHKCRQWVPSFLSKTNLSANDWAASALTRLVIHT